MILHDQKIVPYLIEHGVRGIVFDIDGTLLDSMGIWEDLGARYLLSLGFIPEENLNAVLFPMTLTESTAYLQQHYHLDQTSEEIRLGFTNILASFYEKEVACKEGVIEILADLQSHDIPMVLATTGDKNLAEAALSRLGIWSYFKALLCCEDYHTDKTSPLLYQEAARILNTSVENTLCIEDVLTALQTAHKYGFQTAGIYDAYSEDVQNDIRSLCDYYLPDFQTMEV